MAKMCSLTSRGRANVRVVSAPSWIVPVAVPRLENANAPSAPDVVLGASLTRTVAPATGALFRPRRSNRQSRILPVTGNA